MRRAILLFTAIGTLTSADASALASASASATPSAAAAAAAAAAAPAAARAADDWLPTADQFARLRHSAVLVDSEPPDAGGASGAVRAAVLVHAPRARVFETMIACANALRFVPRLIQCRVRESGPARQWQVIEQTMDLRWFLPRAHYVLHVDYEPGSSVCFHAIEGDLRVNEGCWRLRSDGEDTIVTYRVRLEPRFYVPRWLLREGLRRDLPEMLGALRDYCEGASAPPRTVSPP